MKSNQMMEVKIGSLGILNIGHKTKFGKLADIFSMGNDIRESRGERRKDIKEFLRKESTWKYIAELNNILSNMSESNCAVTAQLKSTVKYDFSEYKDSDNKILYKDLIKQFPNVIKSQRGKYGGTWCHLELLMKAAMYLDAKLEAEVIHTFVTQNILELRDEGGNQFLKLNKAIDSLPDRQPKLKPNGNKGCYIQVAKLIRDKLNILESRGYNEKEHNSKIQELRTKIEDFSVKIIEMKMVNSYDELKTFIINFPID